jgi:hypothetical protein
MPILIMRNTLIIKKITKIHVAVLFCVFVSSCATKKVHTDSTNIIVAVDNFIDFSFPEREYELTEEHIKILVKLGSVLNEKPADNQWYLFEVIPSSKEESCTAYDRLQLIFNYLKENYKIQQSKFKIVFHEKTPLDMQIRFSIIQF